MDGTPRATGTFIGLDTVLEVVEGMQFDRGYLSPYFVTGEPKGSSVLRGAMRGQDERASADGALSRLL